MGTDWQDHRLKELLDRETRWLGLQLAGDQIAALLSFGQELERQNRRFNLTAISEPPAVIRKHFADSLAPVPYLPTGIRKLVDIGSGAGFPGLVLKICCPDLDITLVESIKKKAAFLTQTAAFLGLDGVNVIERRAEQLGHETQYREQFDVATARAVAPLPALLELCLPLLSVGGCFIAYKGPQVDEEIRTSAEHCHCLGAQSRR